MITRLFTALLACAALGPAAAAGPVSTGVVTRGVTLTGPPGAPGTKVSPGKMCDFSAEDVDQNGRMTGASVQCKAGGAVPGTNAGLPARFNAYCVVPAPRLPGGARLITAPIPGDANHCDLSAMKPGDATQQFGGAFWR